MTFLKMPVLQIRVVQSSGDAWGQWAIVCSPTKF